MEVVEQHTYYARLTMEAAEQIEESQGLPAPVKAPKDWSTGAWVNEAFAHLGLVEPFH
jgi:hypothetical protein